jgi:hypothetical protein
MHNVGLSGVDHPKKTFRLRSTNERITNYSIGVTEMRLHANHVAFPDGEQ